MRLHVLVSALLILCIFTLDVNAQSIERKRPVEWNKLVNGGRFMDRFLPMPVQGQLTSETWGADNVVPRYINNGLEDNDWSYWGGNAKLGTDGRYHLFVCRWREDSPKGHMQWPRSEVVHAVSGNSFGPYKVQETIGKGHNPEVFQLTDGRYVIYVMGGYYIADGVDGPWEYKKFEFKPRDRRIIEGLSNLTFARREDGSFLMVCRGGGVWFSKTGTSPYNQITDARVYPPVEGHFEDPLVWRTNVQYHLIVNDWYGRIAYYLRSKDGINWKVEPGEAYLPGIAKYEDGTKVDWFKYERIKVLQDKYGRATQTHFAVIDAIKWDDKGKDNHSSKHICIPLTVGRLLTILDQDVINAGTKSIRVKIAAEEGFNPHADIDIDSLRFGASEEVNFGRGCKAVKTQRSGKDLIVTFDGTGNGITDNNFAAKLLGTTSKGKLLFGYTRLPGLNYIEPALSARIPVFVQKEDGFNITVEVQNFGQIASKPANFKVAWVNDDQTKEVIDGMVPALKPFQKASVSLTCGNVFKVGVSYDMNIIISPVAQAPVSFKKQVIPLPIASIVKNAAIVCSSGHKPNNSQGFNKLLDGNTKSKLCLVHNGKPVQIDITLNEPKVARGYSFVTANDVPARDPRAWTVQGSNDKMVWDNLDKVENNPKFKKRFGRKRFGMKNDTAYKFYRFVFYDNHGDSHFQLSELEMDNVNN